MHRVQRGTTMGGMRLALVFALTSVVLLACSSDPADGDDLSAFGHACTSNADCGAQAHPGDISPQCWQWSTAGIRATELRDTCVIYCDAQWNSSPDVACQKLTGHGCTTDRAGWSICAP